MRIAKELGATSKNLHSFRVLPSNYESQPEAFWCTSGGAAGGYLGGAAFRQRSFVTDDEILCGYQRIFRHDCAV